MVNSKCPVGNVVARSFLDFFFFFLASVVLGLLLLLLSTASSQETGAVFQTNVGGVDEDDDVVKAVPKKKASPSFLFGTLLSGWRTVVVECHVEMACERGTLRLGPAGRRHTVVNKSFPSNVDRYKKTLRDSHLAAACIV